MNVDITPTVLGDDGIAEACRQTHPLWHQGLDYDGYEERLRKSFAGLHGTMRYAGIRHSSGALAASARLLDLDLALHGRREPTVGIAAVFVREDLRGAGLGRTLIQGILREAHRTGVVHALLFSDIGHDYYARLGFVAAPARDWTARIADVPRAASLAVRAATNDDADWMLRAFNTRADQASLCPARSYVWWRHYRWWRNADPDLVFHDGFRDVGYATVRRDGTLLRVFEWIAPDVEPERVWATLRAEAVRLGCDRMGGWLQPDRREPWMTVVERAEGLPMAARTDGAPMDMPPFAVFEELDHF